METQFKLTWYPLLSKLSDVKMSVEVEELLDYIYNLKFEDNSWESISKNPNLTPKHLRLYKDKIIWKHIRIFLYPEEITEFREYIDLNNYHYDVSNVDDMRYFLENDKFTSKVLLSEFAYKSCLDLLIEYKDKIDWSQTQYIYLIENLSDNNLSKLIDVLEIETMFYNGFKAPLEVMDEFIRNNGDNGLNSLILSNLRDNHIEDVLLDYIDYVDMNTILDLNKLSKDFISKNIDIINVDINNLLKTQSIPMDVFISRINIIDMMLIKSTDDVPESYIKDNYYRFNMDEISKRKLSPEFVKEFSHIIRMDIYRQYNIV